MAKFPNSPGVEALKRLTPATVTLPGGTRFARVYYADSPSRLAWNTFRYGGPVNARWDHHLPDASGRPCGPARGMYYAALDAKTCLAELFQGTRCIDRTFQSPWLVIFETAGSLKLLDLNGGAPALALNDRALLAKVLASQPLVHRALADDVLLDPLKHAASSLRYALC